MKYEITVKGTAQVDSERELDILVDWLCYSFSKRYGVRCEEVIAEQK